MSCGFGSLALSAMVQRDAACSNQLATQLVQHPPRAKRVIFLFMAGGVSQIDSYDYKEKLFKDDGKMIRFDDARTLAKTRQIVKHRVMKPLWNFRQHGECGQPVSALFPHTARSVSYTHLTLPTSDLV